jgi:thioester reductase-like protein
MSESNQADTTLITGGSGFIGWRLTRALAARGRPLALLVRPASRDKLRRRLAGLDAGQAARVRLVSGDLEQPGLGLAAADRDWLRQRVTQVYHLGAAYDMCAAPQQLERTNVAGTRQLLDEAAAMPRLERFCHCSSIAVSGTFAGHYRESDFDRGQQPLHAYGRTKFEAERLVRASGLPLTVFRPGVVVGDSRSGEMDKIDGPYLALAALHAIRRLPGAGRLPMIVPRDDSPLFHLVPVDFVAEAMAELGGLEHSLGRTYHLTDPAPVSFRRFYLACLEQMGFDGPTIGRPVQRLVHLLLRPPLAGLLRHGGRRLGLPFDLLPHLVVEVTYDTAATEADLAASGLRCPPLLEILPRLVDYFERHLA